MSNLPSTRCPQCGTVVTVNLCPECRRDVWLYVFRYVSPYGEPRATPVYRDKSGRLHVEECENGVILGYVTWNTEKYSPLYKDDTVVQPIGPGWHFQRYDWSHSVFIPDPSGPSMIEGYNLPAIVLR
jgi:hypothetical protein